MPFPFLRTLHQPFASEAIVLSSAYVLTYVVNYAHVGSSLSQNFGVFFTVCMYSIQSVLSGLYNK